MSERHPIHIRFGTTDVEVDTPLWGYTTRIVMPFTIVHTGGLKWVMWDNGAGGSNYDRRYLKCEWMLDKTLTNSLLDIFKNTAKGRGIYVTLKLGTTSGFFPFGVDKGDSGDFICNLLSINPKPSIGHPQDYFQCECEFLFTGSYPVYVLPAQVNEGNLSLGTIANLRYPQNMHDQDITYKVDTMDTVNFSAYVNDRTSGADSFVASMSIDLLGPNMAALIDHLVGTVRVANVTLTPPANAYLYGRENGDGPFTCKWIDNEIEIVHRGYNDFGTTLKFAKVA